MKKAIRLPGILILIMSALWSLPFVVITIAQEPTVLKYHLLHLKFFAAPIISTIVLNKNKWIIEIWKKDMPWPRFFIIITAYWISSIVTIPIVSGGGYYGGDGGGSYALFLLPSAVVYTAIGILYGISVTVFAKYRKQKNESNETLRP